MKRLWPVGGSLEEPVFRLPARLHPSSTEARNNEVYNQWNNMAKYSEETVLNWTANANKWRMMAKYSENTVLNWTANALPREVNEEMPLELLG
jgi:hypothetical protein